MPLTGCVMADVVGYGVCELCGAKAEYRTEKRGGAIYEYCTNRVGCGRKADARGPVAQKKMLSRMTETVIDKPVVESVEVAEKPEKPERYVPFQKEQKPDPVEDECKPGKWRVVVAVLLAVMGLSGVAWRVFR